MKIDLLYKSEKNIPFICGSFINALGLVRSFGIENINSVVIDYKNGIAANSKYSVWLKSPKPKKEKEFIDFLINVGMKLKRKGFLLVTNDIWLLPIAKNKKELEKYFIIPMSDWEVINNALNKSYLYDFASNHNILHPKTKVIKNFSITEVNNLQYPIILKPSMTTDFTGVVKEPRNTIVKNKNELETWFKDIKKYAFNNIEVIAQEYIPGGTETLYTITSYTNIDGELKAFSIGHKIRQFPINAGTITSGKVSYNQLLHKTAEDFFCKFKFHGIANTEFKYDKRDNTFKLIEINARPGKWNSSACVTDINLPLIAYNDLVFSKIDKNIIFNKQEVIWIDGFEDYRAYINTIKNKNFFSFKNFLQWWNDFEKIEKTFAIYNINDLKPFLYYNFIKIKSFIKRFVS